MNRRVFLAGAAKAGLAGVTLSGLGAVMSGCGSSGGGRNAGGETVQTGGSGRVRDVAFFSGDRSVFVPRNQIFEINWQDGNPPAQFTVFLRRFLEPRGGGGLSFDPQRVEVNQLTGSRWSVRRRDNFDLDAGGVYYLEITSPGQTSERFAFIVSNDRSRAVTVNPGTNGLLEDVIISPRPGSVFVERGQLFTLEWTGAFPPPSQFTAQLRRYREKRGSDDGSDSEQDIVLNRQGNAFVWTLERRNNSLLDAHGTYYIELTAPGADIIRAPFITAGF